MAYREDHHGILGCVDGIVDEVRVSTRHDLAHTVNPCERPIAGKRDTTPIDSRIADLTRSADDGLSWLT